jgi:2-polyprenyl-6-hydroxyphenyl methylase/3-demethylubiquinone-9 3-methyltransferase
MEKAPSPSSAGAADTATDFFGAQAQRWYALYQSKPTFKDRLALFTGAARQVLPPGGRILDFGCGAGNISLALAEGGFDVVGVDGALGMLEAGRAEAERRGLARVSFERMDAAEVRLEPEAYDGIVCSSVIEYVPDDARLVSDLIRAIRPGGHLLISVPHKASLFGRAEDLWKRIALRPGEARGRHLTFSLRRYSRRGFLDTLERAGLGDFRCRYYETPVPGRVGVLISRVPLLGVMLLVVARKTGRTAAG